MDLVGLRDMIDCVSNMWRVWVSGRVFSYVHWSIIRAAHNSTLSMTSIIPFVNDSVSARYKRNVP